MIIFETILTTFKSSTVFRGSWSSSVKWLEPKIDQSSVQIREMLCTYKKIAAQNYHTSLSTKNGHKLCSLHSQLAKAVKKINF